MAGQKIHCEVKEDEACRMSDIENILPYPTTMCRKLNDAPTRECDCYKLCRSAPTPMNKQHPNATWGIYYRHWNYLAMAPLVDEFGNSIEGYSANHGGWMLFEHYEDAVLWQVYHKND